MLNLKVLFTCAVLLSVSSLFACSPAEPQLPSNAVEDIKGKLGYALAPTYLPEGFEYHPGTDNTNLVIINMGTSRVEQMYTKITAEGGMVHLAMIYPAPDISSGSFLEDMRVVKPEDAVSEAVINGSTAYLTHGSWSLETLGRIARLELPIDPEWDYQGGISIRFDIEVTDKDTVQVIITTMLPGTGISDEEIIKIARSVVLVD